MRVISGRWFWAVAALGFLLLGFVLGRFSASNVRPPHDLASAEARSTSKTSGHLRAEHEARSPLSSVRVEELSHIPPSELAEVLEHRDAREIALLAQKFDSLPPNPQTYANLRPLFKMWAQLDEKAAFKTAVAFTDQRTQEMAIDTIATSASPDGAGRIAQLIREQPAGTFRDGIKEQLLDPALVNWSQTDPAAAAEFIVENPELREISLTKILRNFGWIEGAAAIKWLNEHPSKNDYTGTSEWSEALLGWLEKTPTNASTYIVDHLDEGSIRESISSAATGLYYVDKSLALQWPGRLPAGDIRETAMTQIARAYSETDPKAAAAWVAGFPRDTGTDAFGVVMSKWTTTDADAALAWINSGAGNRRDEALAFYSHSLFPANPDKAIETANSIFDPALRIRTLETIIGNTPASAAERVKRWIASSLLSREQKAQLLARMEAAQAR